MTLTKAQREKVRMMFGGYCAYCGCLLDAKWHADHVEPIKRAWEFVRDAAGCIASKNGVSQTRATGELLKPENDHTGNLFPACVPCNIDKGCMPLEEWRQYLHYRIVERLRVNSSTFRHGERFGIVTVNPAPLVFHFEKFCRVEPPSAS